MRLVALVLCAAHVAAAQPAPTPPPEPPPLAQIRSPKQLQEVLAAMTQDPAIVVDNPQTRPLAQALMTEGVKQLQARSYDQALANFLEAYAKFPSPKILLNIASTLRDMGRLADAANTYQRWLTDPATGSERIAEVKDLLLSLDEQLTILTVRVKPHGSDISIDAGPFVAVGSTLITRVRPGTHLIRIRSGEQTEELPVTAFEGEMKEVTPTLPVPDPPAPIKTIPETQNGWLIDGTKYATGSSTSNERKVRATYAGPELRPIVPRFETSDTGTAIVQYDEDAIDSGVIGVLRIDGKGRGAAGGVGLAIARGNFEGELMVLKSDEVGGYIGARYRFLTGFIRPYAGFGLPGFAYDHEELQMDGSTKTTTKFALGVRAAGGVELVINGHLSVQGDLGYEHFFFVDDHYEADVFVPTLGVIGRL